MTRRVPRAFPSSPASVEDLKILSCASTSVVGGRQLLYSKSGECGNGREGRRHAKVSGTFLGVILLKDSLLLLVPLSTGE